MARLAIHFLLRRYAFALPLLLFDLYNIDIHCIQLKSMGIVKKITGHNSILCLVIMVYVCGVWRPSKSSMPVIYQHIFALPAITLHNLSSFHLTFSGWAPRLNSFHGEFVIKSYHKTAFKDAQMLRQCSANAPEKWPKTAPKTSFLPR